MLHQLALHPLLQGMVLQGAFVRLALLVQLEVDPLVAEAQQHLKACPGAWTAAGA
jgi:hypothetical protein